MMSLRIDIPDLSRSRRATYVSVGVCLGVTFVASMVALYLWLASTAAQSYTIEACYPGEDGRPEGLDALEPAAELSGIFLAFDGSPSEIPGLWTNFRGEDSDNVVAEAPQLASNWPADGPEALWSVSLGEGYAAPVVLGGCVYILDYDEEKRADALRCLSLADGKEIWRRSYEVSIKRNHGMSRTIPAVTDQYIVTVGPRCHVVCLDTATGDFRWGIDLQREYGTEEPLWYTGQCPIIEDGQAVIAPCGEEVLMMAVDCESGETTWSVPNTRGWNMSHSSIIPMTLLGKRMYVYAALGGLTAVSAEPEDRGTLLWERPWDAKVVAPSPVKSGDDLLFMTAGYGKGSMMLRLSNAGGAWSTETLFETSPKDGLACEQQTPIFHDGLLYGIMPKDAGGLKGQFACYQPDGTLVWSSGQDNRFGLGPFILADGKFFLLSDDGVLTMLDAGKQEYTQLAQAEVLEGHDAWGPIALAGSRMLVRDMGTLVCLDVGAGG